MVEVVYGNWGNGDNRAGATSIHGWVLEEFVELLCVGYIGGDFGSFSAFLAVCTYRSDLHCIEICVSVSGIAHLESYQFWNCGDVDDCVGSHGGFEYSMGKQYVGDGGDLACGLVHHI